MKEWNEILKKIRNLKKETETIYIYGAGFYGKEIYRFLKNEGIIVDGFLVTSLKNNDKQYMGIPVYEAIEKIDKNIGIIVGVKGGYTEEIIDYLVQNGFDKVRILCDITEWIAKIKGAMELRDNPGLEVTTVIGCKVNCKFCPQSTLLSSYFKGNENRKRVLDVKDFERALSHLPMEYTVMFCGYAEPFLNPNALQLIRRACESGRKVSLYTTLTGVSKMDLEEVVKLPIDYCMLHVADKKGYAKIDVTEEYYEKLEFILNAKKIDGSYFVSSVTAQAETNERVSKICGKRLQPLTAVHDRGGNLEEEEELDVRKEEIKPGDAIECRCTGAKMNTQVLLPDGTVTLCQSDYGLQHVLGNLFDNDMDTIRADKPFQEIVKAVKGQSNMDILCKKCVLARKI